MINFNADIWGGTLWNNFVPFIRKRIDLIFKYKSDRVLLEIGAREGILSSLFKDQFKVICSDISYTEADIKKSTPEITFMNLNCMNIDLDDDSVDIVLAKSVMGGLKDYSNQEIAFNEVFRILRPGGLFFFAENTTGSFIHRILRRIKNKRKLDYWHYCSDDDLTKLSEKYKVISKEYHGVISGTYSFNQYLDKAFYFLDKYLFEYFFKADKRIVVFVCLQKTK